VRRSALAHVNTSRPQFYPIWPAPDQERRHHEAVSRGSRVREPGPDFCADRSWRPRRDRPAPFRPDPTLCHVRRLDGRVLRFQHSSAGVEDRGMTQG